MEELQLRFLEKQLTTKYFLILGQKSHFFEKKWRHHQKKVIALNTYIGTNVLVYERWLVLKVRYTAQHFRHSIDSHMHVSQKCGAGMPKTYSGQILSGSCYLHFNGTALSCGGYLYMLKWTDLHCGTYIFNRNSKWCWLLYILMEQLSMVDTYICNWLWGQTALNGRYLHF